MNIGWIALAAVAAYFLLSGSNAGEANQPQTNAPPPPTGGGEAPETRVLSFVERLASAGINLYNQARSQQNQQRPQLPPGGGR